MRKNRRVNIVVLYSTVKWMNVWMCHNAVFVCLFARELKRPSQLLGYIRDYPVTLYRHRADLSLH